VQRGHALGSCAEPLTAAYDAALFDLDGVLYLEEHGIPHAPDAVADARAAGMSVAYVTNNASRRPDTVADRLTGLGIPAAPDEVVTSAQAAVRLVRQQVRAGAVVLVLGTQALADEVVDGGLRPVRTVAEAADEPIAAVVQGLSPDTCQRDLAEAAVALRSGALWVVGNTDTTLPSRRGPLPGNGAFVAALRLVTGLEPVVAGKPDPALHRESVERVGARRPLVVGDRLDTDVLGAVRGGADSLLVLTGVTDRVALLTAPAGSRPTYVASDLRGLSQPQPEVEVERHRARCGAATATWTAGAITVEGSGDDALRAEAALWWACADAGRHVENPPGDGRYGAGHADEGPAVHDALRSSLSLVGRLAELAWQGAGGVATALTHQGEAAAEQVRALAEDLLAQTRPNRDAVVARVTVEVERALAGLGVATADEMTALLQRVRDLETELRQTAESASELLAGSAGAGITVPEDDGTGTTGT
jgi:glycerol 3-phosphatase-2